MKALTGFSRSALLSAVLLGFTPPSGATTCSYSISIPVGCLMIANHCDHVNGNTLNNLFPAVPHGSQIIKFNKQTQAFDPPAMFSGGVWIPNLTLDPGEGAYFCNPGPAFNVTIAGNPHTPAPLTLPANGCCIVSRQEPLPGGWQAVVGTPPQDQDAVYRFNPAMCNYSYDQFVDGAWEGDAGGIEPIINVGESAWICRGASPPFSCLPPTLICPADVAVQCDEEVPMPNPASVTTIQCASSMAVMHLGDMVSGTCPKVIKRTYQASANCNQTVTCIQTITVHDTVAPVPTCPADLTVQHDTDVPAPNPAAVSATDNCDPAPVITHMGDVVTGTCLKTILRTYKATDACGNVGTCTQTITIHDTQLCSFTQGFYGKGKGKFNGTPSLTLVGNLLAQGSLVVGKLGSRSLSLQPGDAALVQQRLPAGGTPATLPNNGDQTLQTALMLPLNVKGQFINVLLGQTITLSLNGRLSPSLLCIELVPSFCTQAVLPGPDGLRGTLDDVLVPGDILTFSISSSVLNALANPGLGINDGTVQGLLELANRALAGMPTGGASLSEINDAVDAINRGFDECRVRVDCVTGMVIQDSYNDPFAGSPSLDAGGGPGLLAPVLAGAGGGGNRQGRVANLGARKEPGEPDHAGNPGGKSVWWRWTAPQSGPVLLETTGSSFDTLLAVYTGGDVSNLVLVASNDDPATGTLAELTFNAVAATEYHLAVDGYDSGCGTVLLSLIVERPTICQPLVQTGDNVEMCIAGRLGRMYTVEASSDLSNWRPVASVRNTDNILRFVDPSDGMRRQRFYRAIMEFH